MDRRILVIDDDVDYIVKPFDPFEVAAEALLQAKNAGGHNVVPASEMTELRLAF